MCQSFVETSGEIHRFRSRTNRHTEQENQEVTKTHKFSIFLAQYVFVCVCEFNVKNVNVEVIHD